jgi:hypothetical protein
LAPGPTGTADCSRFPAPTSRRSPHLGAPNTSRRPARRGPELFTKNRQPTLSPRQPTLPKSPENTPSPDQPTHGVVPPIPRRRADRPRTPLRQRLTGYIAGKGTMSTALTHDVGLLRSGLATEQSVGAVVIRASRCRRLDSRSVSDSATAAPPYIGISMIVAPIIRWPRSQTPGR